MFVSDLDTLAQALSVSRETVLPLQSYADLLVKWQKAKNIVADSTLPDLWQRHLLDSAQLIPLMGLTPSTENEAARPGNQSGVQAKALPVLMDIGSGGGFPGLVLAALGCVEAHMVESNGRKCSFMRMVTEKTGAHAHIHAERVEALPPFEADFITSRACARLNQLLEWAYPFTKSTTKLWFLKGEKCDEELTEAQASWKMTVKRHKSLTDASGTILEIADLQPVS